MASSSFNLYQANSRPVTGSRSPATRGKGPFTAEDAVRMLDEMLKPAWPEPKAETPEGKAQKSERTHSQHETIESRRDIYGKHQAGEFDFF